MAAGQAQSDALLCFKQCVLGKQAPFFTSSSDRGDAEPNLALATHVHFALKNGSSQSFPLSQTTRFVASADNKTVNLRSILWAWQAKELPIAEYFSSTSNLNEQLAKSEKNADSKVSQISFVERLALISWLENEADDECDYIQPLPNEAVAQEAAQDARIAAGQVPGVATIPNAAPATLKTVDPRLEEIYRGERVMGDRNTVLRGIKPTDFSHVRKYAESFLGRSRQRPGGPTPVVPQTTNPALVSSRSKPTGRRVEPIILLSPSASSLLRTTNIKNFLEEGVYVPADSSLATGTEAGMNTITRSLPSIDPSRKFRFFLVDNLDNFKPDYWARVVAVFTTGQTWQFKNYKWTNPPELFTHALGIFVGFQGELVPDPVKGWGRGVKIAQVDKWNSAQGARGRWRDREVVETIWTAIEESMRAKGWSKDGLR